MTTSPKWPDLKAPFTRKYKHKILHIVNYFKLQFLTFIHHGPGPVLTVVSAVTIVVLLVILPLVKLSPGGELVVLVLHLLLLAVAGVLGLALHTLHGLLLDGHAGHLLDVVIILRQRRHRGLRLGWGLAEAAGFIFVLSVRLDLWSVAVGRGIGWRVGVPLSEALYLQLLCHWEKVVEIFLRDICFSVVHEVQHRLNVPEADALQVEQRMLVGVLPQHASEEGAAGGEDDLVGLDLVILACQGHVKEVSVVSQFTKSNAHVTFKIIPLQAELFWWPHFTPFSVQVLDKHFSVWLLFL